MKKQAKKRGRPKKVVEPVVENVAEVVPDEEPNMPMRGIYEVKTIRACKNPTMVEALLNGEKIVVRASRRVRDRLIGKIIKISRTNLDGGEVVYDYIDK
jgi:hypothetical protein